MSSSNVQDIHRTSVKNRKQVQEAAPVVWKNKDDKWHAAPFNHILERPHGFFRDWGGGGGLSECGLGGERDKNKGSPPPGLRVTGARVSGVDEGRPKEMNARMEKVRESRGQEEKRARGRNVPVQASLTCRLTEKGVSGNSRNRWEG